MASKAEGLYRAYLGSRFGMSRDGVLDEYEALSPDPNDERRWRDELISEQLRAACEGDTDALSGLTILGAVHELPELARLASERDGFYRVRVAETIWYMIDKLDVSGVAPPVQRAALDAATAAAQDVARGHFASPPDDQVEWLLRQGADVREALARRASGRLAEYGRLSVQTRSPLERAPLPGSTTAP